LELVVPLKLAQISAGPSAAPLSETL